MVQDTARYLTTHGASRVGWMGGGEAGSSAPGHPRVETQAQRSFQSRERPLLSALVTKAS